MADTIERPHLTLPEEEAAIVAEAYGAADVILEYGSGGSTALACDLGKRVFSVESDADWCAMMQRWLNGQPHGPRITMHHADIGKTGKWGRPVEPKAFRHFPGYPLSIWDREDLEHPQVVLIDGRFRPACLLATAFRITRPVRVLFDDYVGRGAYHAIEQMFKPIRLHGRMAEFHITPTPIDPTRLNWVMGWFLRPQ